MKNGFKWKFEITVDESLVADGFDIADNESLEEMVRDHWIPFAREWEVKAKILEAPSPERINDAQASERI